MAIPSSNASGCRSCGRPARPRSREFHRVLRPGGRVSLFEPINALNRFGRAFDTAAVQELDDRVRAVFEQLQPPETDPMLSFDDRELASAYLLAVKQA